MHAFLKEKDPILQEELLHRSSTESTDPPPTKRLGPNLFMTGGSVDRVDSSPSLANSTARRPTTASWCTIMTVTKPCSGLTDRSQRVNATQFHLTFAACYPGELSFDQIENEANHWSTPHGGLKEWSIGREEHPEPEDPERAEHFHVYLHFEKRKDIANRLKTKVFDLRTARGYTRHPEIDAVGPTSLDREKVIKYTMKYGDFKCSSGLDIEFGRKPDTMEADTHANIKESWATQLNREPTVASGMQMLAVHHPTIYYTKGATIQQMLHAKLGVAQKQVFDLTDFNRAPLDLDLPTVLQGGEES